MIPIQYINSVRSGLLFLFKKQIDWDVACQKKKPENSHLDKYQLAERIFSSVNEADGKTLLHYAAESNKIEIVNYILSCAKVTTHQIDNTGKKFLDYLYAHGKGKIEGLLPKSIQTIKKSFILFDPTLGNTWDYDPSDKHVLCKLIEDTNAEIIKTHVLGDFELAGQSCPILPTLPAECFKESVLSSLRQDALAQNSR